MDAVLDLLSGLVFLLVFCVFYGVLGLSKRRRKDELAAKRLAQLMPDVAEVDRSEIGSIAREMQSHPFATLPVLGPWIEKFWLSIDLIGWRSQLKSRLCLVGLGGMILGIMIGMKTPSPLILIPVLSLSIAMAVFFVMMQNALAGHHKAMLANLPEVIDALNRTCRAGVPVTNAFILVAENITGPIATEFRLMDHWLKLGVPLRQVLQSSARRVQFSEYRFFAVILIINQESGGRLSETLERLSRTLREREELKLKIMAKTSEARMSAKIVAALVPGMMGYMYVNAPSDFRFLLSDPTGNKVLIYIVASVLMGLLIIHLMVKRVR